MAILLLSGIVLAGTAVAFAMRALAFGGLRRQRTLAQIAGYGFAAPAKQADAGDDRRGLRAAVDQLATGLGRSVLRRLDESHERDARNLLRGAGLYRTEVATYLGYRVMATIVVPLAWLWLMIVSGSFGPRALLGVFMLLGLGWVLPPFLLKRRGTLRLQAVDREMPELVDLLVTTVEAGLGFAASLQLVTRRIEGPLGQELRLVLQEQSMGLTIEEALENLLARVDSASLRAFVQAIVQGQMLGVSIGKILRDLAVDMRKRRRQAGEERAQKAATKILFPLVFFILPALLIVALGGPLIGLVRNLGSF
ncbi:MAG TPA: type II secretion system F family protein [Gaiellaceae bacterium]|nr:type II secretion system F family protein [Gaiellaceae bacterium]